MDGFPLTLSIKRLDCSCSTIRQPVLMFTLSLSCDYLKVLLNTSRILSNLCPLNMLNILKYLETMVTIVTINVFSEYAYSEGLVVIPDITGHGIGSYFHGPPDIFHVRTYFFFSTFLNFMHIFVELHFLTVYEFNNSTNRL